MTTTPHADPNDPAIAAILAFDLNAFANDHAAIAAALEPLVTAAPALREWDVDDEWTAAEEACQAASLIVRDVKVPAGRDPWMNVQNQLKRLHQMQVAHRNGLVYDRLGNFPGYQVRVREFCGIQRINIWPKDVSTDLETPFLSLEAADTTRREVEIAIKAWNAGHKRGVNDGAYSVRKGIREMLGLGG